MGLEHKGKLWLVNAEPKLTTDEVWYAVKASEHTTNQSLHGEVASLARCWKEKKQTSCKYCKPIEDKIALFEQHLYVKKICK